MRFVFQMYTVKAKDAIIAFNSVDANSMYTYIEPDCNLFMRGYNKYFTVLLDEKTVARVHAFTVGDDRSLSELLNSRKYPKQYMWMIDCLKKFGAIFNYVPDMRRYNTAVKGLKDSSNCHVLLRLNCGAMSYDRLKRMCNAEGVNTELELDVVRLQFDLYVTHILYNKVSIGLVKSNTLLTSREISDVVRRFVMYGCYSDFIKRGRTLERCVKFC